MIELASENYTDKVLEVTRLLEQKYGRRLQQKALMPFFNLGQTSTMSYWLSGKVVPSNKRSKRIIDRILSVLKGECLSPVEFKNLTQDGILIYQWHKDCEDAHDKMEQGGVLRGNKTKKSKQENDLAARLENIERKIDILLGIWKGDEK